MRVVIVGPQGSGKTVAAKRLARELRLPFLTEAARSAAKIWRVKMDDPALSLAHRALWQVGIIHEQLRLEQKHTQFVSDRSVIDNLAYAYIAASRFRPFQSFWPQLKNICQEAVRSYDHIFLMPPAGGEGLQEDGFRNVDPEYQKLVAGKIDDMVVELGVKKSVRYVPFNFDWEGKYQFIKSCLPIWPMMEAQV